ncbi:MAG: hypothetical protein PUC65_11685 [Clostridiales bacterium]|nr:hypothetical protein [Clostridiales bacterium]
MFILIGYHNVGRRFKENYLYPINSIPENRISESNQKITRRDAVKKAYDLFESLYGVNLKSSEKQMYINLYKDEQKEQPYQWVMSWYDYETKENYTLTLDAMEGHVQYLYAGIRETKTAEKHPQSMTFPDIQTLVNEFVNGIGIQRAFKLEVSYPVKIDGEDYWQQKCKIIDSASDQLIGIIMVDSTDQMVREYERN